MKRIDLLADEVRITFMADRLSPGARKGLEPVLIKGVRRAHQLAAGLGWNAGDVVTAPDRHCLAGQRL